MNKIIISTLAVLMSLSSFSQKKWSLKECISYAYENNIDLKQKEISVKIAEIAKEKSKLDRLPTLNGELSHSFVYGRSISFTDNTYINENTQNSNFSLSTGVVLFNGLKKSNIIKKSSLDLKAGLKDLETIKSNIAIRIAGAYLDVLYNIELLAVSNEQYNMSEQQYKKSEKLVEAGKFAKGELLKQKALLAQDEVAVIEARNALDIAYLNLYQVMNIKDGDSFEVDQPLNLVVDANRSVLGAKQYYDKAVNKRPEIEAANLRLKSNKKELDIAKAGRCPTLSMGAGWSTAYADNFNDITTGKIMSFSDQIKNNERKYFGFRLDIPIFNGGQVSSSIKNSRYAIDNASFELEKVKINLRQEIQQAYARATAAMKKYYANEVAVTSSKEALRYSQEKYNLGIIDIVSYNQSKKDYVVTKSQYLQAKYDYIFRTKILDFYCGIPMNL